MKMSSYFKKKGKVNNRHPKNKTSKSNVSGCKKTTSQVETSDTISNISSKNLLFSWHSIFQNNLYKYFVFNIHSM